MNERFRRKTRLMLLEQEADLLASMRVHAMLKARRGEHNKLPTDVEKRDKRGRKYYGPADEPAKAPRHVTRSGAPMRDVIAGVVAAAKDKADGGARSSTRRGELPAAGERAAAAPQERRGPPPAQIIRCWRPR